MIADIVLTDDDQAREYHLTVHFKCRPEIGAAPGWCVDLESVWLESCVVWFEKQGSEVSFEYHERLAAARFVERKYDKEIRELCIEVYLKDQDERNVA